MQSFLTLVDSRYSTYFNLDYTAEGTWPGYNMKTAQTERNIATNIPLKHSHADFLKGSWSAENIENNLLHKNVTLQSSVRYLRA